MLGYELHALIVGAVLLVGAIFVVLSLRPRPLKNDLRLRAGLLAPERSLEPPDGQTPGMIGALRDGAADARDARLTLIDLAARGYLRITALVDDNGQAYDWILRRTTKPVDAGLHTFEKLLVSDPFAAVDADERPRTSITFSGLAALATQPLRRAERALTDHVHQQGWYSLQTRQRHSPWGWVGALIVVAGLLLTVAMMFDWLATGDFRGVIGGLLVVAAGILLTAQGRKPANQTAAGTAARAASNDFKDALDDLKAEDLHPEQTAHLFNRLLPWALALGVHDSLADAVDAEVSRTAAWGRYVELDLGWFQVDQSDGEPSARQFANQVGALANNRGAMRASRVRLASR